MNKDFEIRSSELSAENEKLIGYVVKWNSPSELMWGEFVEQFTQGAFSETLSSGADVRALFEHDHTKLLGRTQANTLKLEEDGIGLRFELTPPETSLGKDLLVSVKRGDITGMSFGFRSKAENWNFDLTPCQRIVTNAELVEITVTSIPAYPESNVQIAQRSMEQAKVKLQPKTTALLDRWAELAEL
ncbi:TPA: HK97 family phage prohead protease [Pasteurella multocida]|uniref:HK97 family phage prohead protease n=1 Tax=Pasteurella multocida TaxID=747 RepID=UPI0028DE5A52|nr:HK97 family phage prohead protease [Pasteurella multocida]MDT8767941.1 HK97 family phage prohead protease [Pasteurella multocida]HDR0619600.1 HK97 family phage prohead protease [Pasteurella multocida]